MIRLVVLMYPLSLRNVEDLLFERSIDLCYETVRLWWNRFGPMFAGEIRKRAVVAMRPHTHWRWHLDEMVVTLQKLVAIHGSVHNHFAQERHLVSREIYKERRAMALAEWRSVMG